ncbi:MAG: ABC-2 family transporter protein, partial [Rhodospirillales bacterium]|nr:ABC-2 family transporter protein [Acetobacter sp.]
YWLMLRNSVIREMAFKANFLLWLFTELLWFAGQIIFVDVLFLYTERIADWSKWEVVLLIGTHQIISQIFQAVFYVNLANLPELVRTGRMDLMLLLPMDTQFAVSAYRFGLDNLVNAGVGVAFVVVSLAKLGVVPSALQIACYGVAVVLGAAIHYAIMFTLATLSFWIVRAQGLIYGYFNFLSIARYPEGVFSGVFKLIFTWLVPVIVVANAPARILARASEQPLALMFQLAAVCALSLVLSRAFWLFALRRYSSASS